MSSKTMSLIIAVVAFLVPALLVTPNNALANQFTGFVVDNNGIMRTAGAASNWPGTQLWATSWTSRLLNFNSGRDGNYRLANGTAWKNAGSDGRDLGADVDRVEGATANSPTGNWPSP